jgi:purine-binding chemotaxis protein CheW
MGEAPTTRDSPAHGSELGGKYLTFTLGDEEYGLQILKVQEIIQMQRITRVPRTPSFVRGVINLPGKVIPVIDLREKFGLGRVDDTGKTCIIVVQLEHGATMLTMGVIIDEVKEVIDIGADRIEPPPSLGVKAEISFIMGMGKIDGGVKILLDIARVLATEQVLDIKKAVQT